MSTAGVGWEYQSALASWLDLGFMLKQRVAVPAPLAQCGVRFFTAASACVAPCFTDYTVYWEHNAYWLFDRVESLTDMAQREQLDPADFDLHFYRAYPWEYDRQSAQWLELVPCAAFPCAVAAPEQAELLGFDVLAIGAQSQPGCSFLSCNLLATECEVNEYGLFRHYRDAIAELTAGRFDHGEPGLCRVVAVYRCALTV